MCARAVLVYIALITIVRFGKKRSLGEATAFDAILVIIIGSIAGRAITGGAPLFPSLAADAALVGLHWVFSALAEVLPGFGNFIKGKTTLLIKKGQVQSANLSRAHMSTDDLAEGLRLKGVGSAADVEEARLERSGELSVLKK